MFEFLAGPAERLMGGLLPLYRDDQFAYALAGGIAAAAVTLALLAVLGHLARRAALMAVISRLAGFVRFAPGARREAGATEAELSFHNRFSEIDASLSRPTALNGGLSTAWSRFRRTLVRGDLAPVRSAQRPANVFYSACPPPTWLGFAATLAVGFGLLATFVGLVAALSFASEGMKAADAAAMQTALRDLLFAASSKFVTSIAGIGASIVLRLVERMLTIDLRGRLDALASLIELGVRVEPDAQTSALNARLEALTRAIEAAVGAPASSPAGAPEAAS